MAVRISEYLEKVAAKRRAETNGSSKRADATSFQTKDPPEQTYDRDISEMMGGNSTLDPVGDSPDAAEELVPNIGSPGDDPAAESPDRMAPNGPGGPEDGLKSDGKSASYLDLARQLKTAGEAILRSIAGTGNTKEARQRRTAFASAPTAADVDAAAALAVGSALGKAAALDPEQLKYAAKEEIVRRIVDADADADLVIHWLMTKQAAGGMTDDEAPPEMSHPSLEEDPSSGEGGLGGSEASEEEMQAIMNMLGGNPEEDGDIGMPDEAKGEDNESGETVPVEQVQEMVQQLLEELTQGGSLGGDVEPKQAALKIDPQKATKRAIQLLKEKTRR